MTNEELEMYADDLLHEDENILDRSDSVAVACKVGTKEAILFQKLCEEKLKCTRNEALQMFIDMLRRYMEDKYNLSDELNTMIGLFEGMKDWSTHINLAEPLERKMIVAAIYILGQPHRKGRRMVMVDGSADELTRTETYNIQEILETFMENFDERMYRELRLTGSEMGCTSIYEILTKLINSYKPESQDDVELRKQFEDNRRGEYGQRDLPENGPYRRTMRNSMADYESRLEEWNKRQQTLDFGDE